ncbi:MAG: hypothetical protein GF400_06685 [Candidatus Eisenbacteria bacterium]|nr:hypothetical protein [Candidatus Eisenbacteria bacterium]
MARGELAGADLTEEQLREVERLMTVGYVSGSVAAGPNAGVTVHDRERAYQGLNLLVSGHGPEALLVDMDGRVLHSWRYDFETAWPERELPETAEDDEFWRRAFLLPDGELLAIFEGYGLIKVDSRSNLIWRYDGFCHHDLHIRDDGTIVVLEREPTIVPEVSGEDPILEDFISILTPDGELVRRISILDALKDSDYSVLLTEMEGGGDVFHTNTLEVLDGRLEDDCPSFAAGNVLISILKISTVAVVDLSQEKVVWALRGLWRYQHQPTILPNGRMMVLDNVAAPYVSRVLELDPFTQEIFWSYEGDVDGPFYTASCGSNQRLPNGNTLITESDNGRAMEVTPDKAIVWEFVSPYRAGEEGELVATLFEVVRLEPDLPLDWLPGD